MSPDIPPAFWFNLFLAVAVPLALLVVATVWAAKAFKRRFTVRSMMFAVLLLGLGLKTVHYNFATVYASGYSESQFRRVRIGMTRTNVESILGSPLQRDSTSQRWSPLENWIYSEPPPPGTLGDSYWRRWVMFENGKVVAIIEDYYVD